MVMPIFVFKSVIKYDVLNPLGGSRLKRGSGGLGYMLLVVVVDLAAGRGLLRQHGYATICL